MGNNNKLLTNWHLYSFILCEVIVAPVRVNASTEVAVRAAVLQRTNFPLRAFLAVFVLIKGRYWRLKVKRKREVSIQLLHWHIQYYIGEGTFNNLGFHNPTEWSLRYNPRSKLCYAGIHEQEWLIFNTFSWSNIVNVTSDFPMDLFKSACSVQMYCERTCM